MYLVNDVVVVVVWLGGCRADWIESERERAEPKMGEREVRDSRMDFARLQNCLQKVTDDFHGLLEAEKGRSTLVLLGF